MPTIIKHKCIPGEWVPHIGVRFKEPSDILLKTGEIIKSVYPNGIGWDYIPDVSIPAKEASWDDSQVVAIRILPDAEIKERKLFYLTGEPREKRMLENLLMNSSSVVIHHDQLIKPNQLRDHINMLTYTAKTYSGKHGLREALGKQIKGFLKELCILK